ncbi:histidine phosphatase family protein [Pseudomonas protegens]|uniref:Histidine phosphatase family protein n=1 Tax=Pseudomonas protegens TaxID=380021 RepID=A0A7G8YVC1_9PSED|nr:histidine phosphatase family protein [Pseudomonas protegens]QNL08815.1 histidine phosphatase family protein [Pseudomonas protegens]
MRLYLVRHGETPWTLSRQHTGRTDVPLTAHGETEAKRLIGPVRDIPFSQVLTSPMQRAQRTCALAGLGAHAQIDPQLLEWNYGDYEGLRSMDIQKLRNGWNLFRDGCPNGESPLQIGERADRLISHLRTLEGNVALFSHGQFAAVLAARWVDLPPVAAQHFPLDTASLSILAYDVHHPEVAVIALWNGLSSAVV